ncbi:MAG: hypothetical protein PHV74_12475 [Dehalococcoidia bacterium]|nr:hypothetical protein [Dehalococcoidia bacterium]
MLGRKKTQETPQPETKEAAPQYRTWIVAPHRIIEKFISEPIGPAYKYEGTRVYLAQYKEGSTSELERYIPPGPPEGLPPSLHSPEGLFTALDWRLVRPVYRMEELLMEKLNTALMIGILVVLLFFLYLIFTNVQGG